MDRNLALLILGITGIVAITVVLVVFMLTSDFYSPMRHGGSNMHNMDQNFLEQMIPHHEQAVEMAKIAQEKAEHPELKQLAGTIIEDQNREISEMQKIYGKYYGTYNPNSSNIRGNNPMMSNMTDIEQLKNSDPFDKAFIEEMVPHHRMAIMMAQRVSNSDKSEIRELANSIIRTQSDEINQMKAWYQEWYGQPLNERHM
jgi:uncharacterized protein (DUF305 family)